MCYLRARKSCDLVELCWWSCVGGAVLVGEGAPHKKRQNGCEKIYKDVDAEDMYFDGTRHAFNR